MNNLGCVCYSSLVRALIFVHFSQRCVGDIVHQSKFVRATVIGLDIPCDSSFIGQLLGAGSACSRILSFLARRILRAE